MVQFSVNLLTSGKIKIFFFLEKSLLENKTYNTF